MNINKHLANIIGKSSKKKFIVFEIDDYGESNILSNETLGRLKQNNIHPTHFAAHDRPGSISEMSNLFEILLTVKDHNNRPAIVSPQIITANPDFEAIEKSGFKTYHYKNFVEGLIDYQGNELWDLWNKGIEENIWSPELHGREHLNVNQWMQALQNKESNTRTAFDLRVYGIFDQGEKINASKLSQAFDIQSSEDINEKLDILQDSIDIFKEKFSRTPSIFTPPASKYFPEMEKILFKNNVKVISVSRFHNYPKGDGNYDKKFRYPGQKSKNGLLYSVRNCWFEPHSTRRNDWVDSCLSDISVAFKWNKPAIISTHRINFVGQENINNKGLEQLKQLLLAIIKNWPDVNFVSSRELYSKW